MVLDPIPQSLPVHFFGSRPQPPTSLESCLCSCLCFIADKTVLFVEDMEREIEGEIESPSPYPRQIAMNAKHRQPLNIKHRQLLNIKHRQPLNICEELSLLFVNVKHRQPLKAA